MKRLLCVLGTRPQAIKHYPFQLEMKNYYEVINLHTGQHYDPEMKEAFIKNINLDVELLLTSKDREDRMEEMVKGISNTIDTLQPDMVIVYGDTDTTLAAAIAAKEKQIALCHIEAGLRSYNLEMPEEINRIKTDNISDLLLCPSQEAIDQLKTEDLIDGVYLVGDIMKDAIKIAKERFEIPSEKNYYYATLHRPYNVDEKNRLTYILTIINNLKARVVLPLHPRTFDRMERFNISRESYSNIDFISPQSHSSNLKYMMESIGILTDSGGMQKEAYWISKKCVTIRSETEWKETLHNSCNTLLFEDLSKLQETLDETPGPWDINLYGDGNARNKIREVIDEYFKRA